MKKIVLYHHPCMDGTGAAMVAKSKVEDDAEYIGVQYDMQDQDLLEICKNRDVFMLDISYPRATMLKLIETSKSLTVIDHHDTAEKELVGLPVVFDKSKSGAELAHDFFIGGTVPLFIQYLADHDLYTFKLPNSKELYMYIASLELNMDVFHEEMVKFENPEYLKAAVDIGSKILGVHDKWCEDLADKAHEITLDGVKGVALNIDGPITMKNKVGEILAKRSGTFAALWNVSPKENKAKVSLRGIPGGMPLNNFATRLATSHGGRGGGHPAASGMTMPIDAWINLLGLSDPTQTPESEKSVKLKKAL